MDLLCREDIIFLEVVFDPWAPVFERVHQILEHNVVDGVVPGLAVEEVAERVSVIFDGHLVLTITESNKTKRAL